MPCTAVLILPALLAVGGTHEQSYALSLPAKRGLNDGMRWRMDEGFTPQFPVRLRWGCRSNSLWVPAEISVPQLARLTASFL